MESCAIQRTNNQPYCGVPADEQCAVMKSCEQEVDKLIITQYNPKIVPFCYYQYIWYNPLDCKPLEHGVEMLTKL